MENKKYDLEERTLKFSEDVIFLCKKVKITILNRNIVDQLLRSATSMGANYREANGAISKKDFSHKIYICKKEAKETYYWLHLLRKTTDSNIDLLEEAIKESAELLLIFSKIASSSRQFSNCKL